MMRSPAGSSGGGGGGSSRSSTTSLVLAGVGAAAVLTGACLLVRASRAAATGAAAAAVPSATAAAGGAVAGVASVGAKRGVATSAVAAVATAAAESPVACLSGGSAVYVKLREIERLKGVAALLDWDEQTQLPTGASKARNEQKEALSAIIHRLQTADALHAGLEQASAEIERDAVAWLRRLDAEESEKEAGKEEGKEESQQQESAQQLERRMNMHTANVREALMHATLARAVPEDVAAREASLTGECFAAWRKAREENDWSIFAPYLQQAVDMRKTIAQLKHPDLDPYAGMMAEFMRGLSAARVGELFAELKRELLPILKKVRATTPRWEVHPDLRPSDRWTKAGQEALSKELTDAMGFDTNRGRVDVSVHPFTGGPSSDDVRFTVTYSDDFRLCVGAAVHEAGHSLYEQGRPSGEFSGLPVARAMGMETHESQSLIWEKNVFQSIHFARFMLPLLHKHFPHTENVTARDLYHAINEVTPGLIRVEADELHYPFHVILRYEIEQGLADGSIAVEDVPKLWRDKMVETIGSDPGDDLSKGALQDIHWSFLAMGYFPSYTLGALTAAQLFNKAKHDIPNNLERQISRGELGHFLQWLRTNIHSRGSLHASSDVLLAEVTGEPLRVHYFTNYLREKYLGGDGLYSATYSHSH